jgi:diguanylate cyclase (GGDEF)-like protein
LASLDRIVSLEKARTRRTRQPFAVLQLEAPGLHAAALRYGLLFAEAARERLREVVGDAVRECDVLVPLRDGALALVLPETPPEGAQALASRLNTSVGRAFADRFLGRRTDPAVRSTPRAPEAFQDPGPAGDEDPDPLTGLPGERAFRAAVARELRRARRYQAKLALVLFDLDDFAAVDAALPREAADALVREAASLLRAEVREVDLAARPGEDELALLLPGANGIGARAVAERFRAAVERCFASASALTVSGGVASYPTDARAPELLLERAARALYAAKAAGGNVVR